MFPTNLLSEFLGSCTFSDATYDAPRPDIGRNKAILVIPIHGSIFQYTYKYIDFVYRMHSSVLLRTHFNSCNLYLDHREVFPVYSLVSHDSFFPCQSCPIELESQG